MDPVDRPARIRATQRRAGETDHECTQERYNEALALCRLPLCAFFLAEFGLFSSWGVPRILSARLCKPVMDVSGWKGLRRSGYVPRAVAKGASAFARGTKPLRRSPLARRRLAKAEARPTRGGFAQGWGARVDTDALSVESRAPGLTGSWWAEDGPFRPGAIRAARYLVTESSTAALPPRRRSTTTPTPKTSTTAAPMIAHISTGRHDSSLPSVMAFWESEICSWT